MQPDGSRPANDSKRWLILELVLLFAAIPALFLVDLPRPITVAVIITALLYVIGRTVRLRLIPRAALLSVRFHDWKAHLLLFASFALLSAVGVALYEPSLLFRPPRQHPRLWLTFLLVYSILSVYPQTFVFRGYFLERYRPLFPHRGHLIIANALLFAWAHAIIAHPLVYALSFCGGILFSITYLRNRSLLVTAIEHALYGSWLFTVGIGGMFAFPI